MLHHCLCVYCGKFAPYYDFFVHDDSMCMDCYEDEIDAYSRSFIISPSNPHIDDLCDDIPF